MTKRKSTTAVALLRLPQAMDFLVELAATGPDEVAKMAISALTIHHYDARLRERTAAAVAKTGQPEVQAFFEERFGTEEKRAQ